MAMGSARAVHWLAGLAADLESVMPWQLAQARA